MCFHFILYIGYKSLDQHTPFADSIQTLNVIGLAKEISFVLLLAAKCDFIVFVEFYV